MNPETNDTSFESLGVEILGLGEKFGMASSWRWPHPLLLKKDQFYLNLSGATYFASNFKTAFIYQGFLRKEEFDSFLD